MRKRRKSARSTPSTTKTSAATSSSPARKPPPRSGRFLRLAGQLPLQNLVHLPRVRLSLGRLHHLTDEGVERLFLSGAVIFDLLCVRGEDLVDDFFDRAGIADLFQAALFDDVVDGGPERGSEQVWWNVCRLYLRLRARSRPVMLCERHP